MNTLPALHSKKDSGLLKDHTAIGHRTNAANGLKRALFVTPTAATLALCAALNCTPCFADPIPWAIELRNVRSEEGTLRVSVYSDPATFRKEARALKLVEVPATRGNVRVAIEGMEPGRYAVMAYHDENGDGKLNLRLGMFPVEGYGLSRNPQVMGPPRFEDGAIDVSEPGHTESIDIRY